MSPQLHVGAGNFSFTFKHHFSFEADSDFNYDGGVIEVSTDGTTWTDVGSSIMTNGYTRLDHPERPRR